MDETAITLDFGRGTYRFWLPMPRIIEIERNCGDTSIVTIYESLSDGIGLDRETDEPRFLGTGPARISHISEVIRCAAIGGGQAEIAGEVVKVGPLDAQQLVADYVTGRPYTEHAPVAWAILHAAIMGVKLGSKKKAEAESERRSEKAA
ncbi:GTA-gp10 family protein [Sphingomonas baiyangensis]|uniref:Gene transfer agent family protein n=1 Tax=Sphingomonas baiyangensis TaxID=2572576 RepID=A0A4U1L230_9SPHN|nr:GTA-gp10 family protein [Sphingomonas baiyangensis]TKD50223.1 gene transfer agent family protein [Sphingomonas baiyangensis]